MESGEKELHLPNNMQEQAILEEEHQEGSSKRKSTLILN